MNKTFLTLLAGIAIGILIAPGKGSETLEKISDRINDLADNFTKKSDDLIRKGGRALKEGQEQLSEMGKSETHF